jgi:hypothetical protein
MLDIPVTIQFKGSSNIITQSFFNTLHFEIQTLENLAAVFECGRDDESWQ